MATYYKYAQREADSYVNWAEIGKNMSDMLADENKVREEKKAAIDESSRQLGLTLANPPQGENRLMNEWALKFTGNAQSQMLMMDKLLKSGKMKLNDYLINKQNLVDGTKNAFGLVSDFQNDFKEMWDRMQNNESAGLEQKFAKEVESFGDFNKSDLYIDPTSSKVNVAYKEKKIVDGKEVYTMSSNPNNFSDISALRNRFKMRVDKYKLPESMDAVVGSFGEQIDAIEKVKATLGAQGEVLTVSDILNKKNLPADVNGVVMKFKDAETQILEGQLSNAFNAASILDDYKNTAPNGKLYDYTWDAEEAKKNPELILLKNESGKAIPVLSKEQHDVALEHLRLQVRMRISHKEELKVGSQLQLQERRATTREENDEKYLEGLAENFAEQTSNLISGTDAQSDLAIKNFRAQGVELEKNPVGKPAGIYINTGKGLVPFVQQGKTTDYGKSIVGTLLKQTGTDLADTRVIKYFKKFMKPTFNLTAKGTGALAPRDVENEFSKNISGKVSSTLFDNQKSTTSGPQIEAALKDIPGVTVNYSGAGSPFNDINISYLPKGAKESKKLQLNSNVSGSEANAQVTKLVKFLTDNVKSEEKLQAIGPEKPQPEPQPAPSPAAKPTSVPGGRPR